MNGLCQCETVRGVGQWDVGEEALSEGIGEGVSEGIGSNLLEFGGDFFSGNVGEFTELGEDIFSGSEAVAGSVGDVASGVAGGGFFSSLGSFLSHGFGADLLRAGLGFGSALGIRQLTGGGGTSGGGGGGSGGTTPRPGTSPTGTRPGATSGSPAGVSPPGAHVGQVPPGNTGAAVGVVAGQNWIMPAIAVAGILVSLFARKK